MIQKLAVILFETTDNAAGFFMVIDFLP